MSNQEFNEVFGLLLAVYPNTKNVEKMATVYFLALGNELNKQEFLNATLKIIKTNKSGFIPSVAEILEIAQKGDNVEQQLFYAKKLLKNSIVKYGNSGYICFEDKGLHAVIDYVGWSNLCMMLEKEFDNFLQWQFDGIYKEFLKNPYVTNDYYLGINKVFGKNTPTLITYESIGINNVTGFVALDYKENASKLDYKNLKNKMLISG